MDKVENTPLRKISAKTVWGKIKAEHIPEKGSKPLYRVIGQAMGTREGDGDYGDWVALVGNFEAVNLETGEVFDAPQCFLPEPFHSAIVKKVSAEGTIAVDFAFEVGVKAPGPDATVRYEYTCKALADPSKADPLAALRSRLPALPPPPKKEGEESADDAAGKGGGKGGKK